MDPAPEPDEPTREEIAYASAVRQCLLQAAQRAAPIQALADLIGFGSVTFKIQDHLVIRALVETSEKVHSASLTRRTKE